MMPPSIVLVGTSFFFFVSGLPGSISQQLLFTLQRLKSSMDVFPIEIADIQDNHKVLFGIDPVIDLNISYKNLRIERMKKGEKIKDLDVNVLFERYLKTVEAVVDAVDDTMRNQK